MPSRVSLVSAAGSDSFSALTLQIFREAPHERFHLRIATGRPEATPEAWTGVEHAIWVEDLPRLAQPATSVDANRTHTDFSRSLVKFLRSGSLNLRKTGKVGAARSAALASLEQNLRLVDFSSSESVRLVASHTGSYVGAGDVSGAGGLSNLAETVASLSPSCDGAGEWQVEYIVIVFGRGRRAKTFWQGRVGLTQFAVGTGPSQKDASSRPTLPRIP